MLSVIYHVNLRNHEIGQWNGGHYIPGTEIDSILVAFEHRDGDVLHLLLPLHPVALDLPRPGLNFT